MPSFARLKQRFSLYVAFSSVYTAAALKGDFWCGTLMCIDATVHNDTVNYELTALDRLGWMAIGFGHHMPNTPMVVMWQTADGTAVMSQRRTTGYIEPSPDSSPPRLATMSARDKHWDIFASQVLAFDVPTNNDTVQHIIWAYSMVRPDSDPNSRLEQHAAVGKITLDLTKEITPYASSSPAIPEASKVPAPETTLEDTTTTVPTSLARHEKLIIAHAILVTLGFMILLPLGALIARWARTISHHWLKAHWVINMVIALPIITVGWALGALAVADQGTAHLRDAHMVCGVLLFIFYVFQILLGRFIQLRQSIRETQLHPPKNILHIILGLLIVGGGFFQTRSGIREWSTATGRLQLPSAYSSLWTAWVIMVPLSYLLGLMFLRRQIVQERLGMSVVPLHYIPFSDQSSDDPLGASGGGRRTAIIFRTSDDDGTHDLYSLPPSPEVTPSDQSIGMREVRLAPLVAPMH